MVCVVFASQNGEARTYCSLITEPSTKNGLEQLVRKSSLENLRGEEGKSTVLILLDTEQLGSPGQHAQARQHLVNFDVATKLIQGGLLGRGAQLKNEETKEATVHVDGDLVVVLGGLARTSRRRATASSATRGRRTVQSQTARPRSSSWSSPRSR